MTAPTDDKAALQAEAEAALFRRRNRQFALATTLMIAAIALFMVLTLGVIVLRGQAMGGARVGRLLLSWSPAIGYLWALWSLRTMFQTLARDGLAFQPKIIRALGRVGWALGAGAILTLAQAPLVAWLIGGVGSGGAFATVNLPAMTLVVTGLALTALARMLRRGAALEAQAAKLKAVLEDFI